MQIDSRLATAKTRLGLIVSFIMAFATWGLMYMPGMYQVRIYGFIAAGLFGLFYLGLHFRNPFYFYFDDAKKTITIRYYNAHPLLRKPKMVQIPFQALDGFEFTKKIGGWQTYLVLYQKTPKGVFTYPPISISLLSAKEKEMLRKNLKSINLRNIALKR